MLVRVLAFALNAREAGLRQGFHDDEPDLWQRDLTGRIRLWIDVGQPDEKLERQACGRADGRHHLHVRSRRRAVVGAHSAAALERAEPARGERAMTGVPGARESSQRTMELQCTIQEGHVWLGTGDETVEGARFLRSC